MKPRSPCHKEASSGDIASAVGSWLKEVQRDQHVTWKVQAVKCHAYQRLRCMIKLIFNIEYQYRYLFEYHLMRAALPRDESEGLKTWYKDEYDCMDVPGRRVYCNLYITYITYCTYWDGSDVAEVKSS